MSLKLSEHFKNPPILPVSHLLIHPRQGTNNLSILSLPPLTPARAALRPTGSVTFFAAASWQRHTGSDYKHKLAQSAREEIATPHSQLAPCQQIQNTAQLPAGMTHTKKLHWKIRPSGFAYLFTQKEHFSSRLRDSPCCLPSTGKPTGPASQSLRLQCLQ